ncbi:MAG: membrane protein insertase YidC [Candidatus Paracaedibacteraceae bacterium]|nr:membrane protein insertase YidC [Candidatus Paracaedibacteraceae bacterium]
MNEQKNVIIACFLSMAVLLGYNYFVETPKAKHQAEIAKQVKASMPVEVSKVEELVDRNQALGGKRVKIKAPKVHGSINLIGSRFDDVTLADYHETTQANSSEIILLSPKKSKQAYFADFGWISGASQSMPTPETLWTASSSELTDTQPVVLRWDNGQGLHFTRTISIDDQYMFTVSDKVENKTANSLKVNAYGQITRVNKPQTGGYYILHEGPIGVLNGKLVEIDYDKLKEKGVEDYTSTGGWLGITDKYWLVSLIPDQKNTYHTKFRAQTVDGVDRFLTETITPEYEVAAGQSLELTQHLFAGAKNLRILDAYESKLGFEKFDLAVDFGIFYFLTKPLFYVLEYLNKLLGNIGVAILLLTVIFKVAMFPLANKSYRSMSRMKTLQPKMEALKQRYGSDKMRLNQEFMELYKKEKINPMAGCLPIVIQAPVFFCLYKVLFVTLEMRHAPFYGWIHDLSAPDPTSVFNLFGLLPFTPPSFLMIGAWPLIMGATMLLQQKLSPQPADSAQAKAMMIMPVMMTILLANFPAGLVIYWAWNNILSIAQQWWIMRLEERRTTIKAVS